FATAAEQRPSSLHAAPCATGVSPCIVTVSSRASLPASAADRRGGPLTAAAVVVAAVAALLRRVPARTTTLRAAALCGAARLARSRDKLRVAVAAAAATTVLRGTGVS
ncbi:unnamed protein product, partial [Prorocentrum cordatum]